MKSLADAVADFESETAVERQLFLLLAESSGECEDVVALRQAGTRIAEAAQRLLETLDQVQEATTEAKAAGGSVLRLEPPLD